MKAIVFVLIILIFNVAMSVVTQSGLFTASGYYESEIIERYNPDNLDITNISKTETDAPSMDIFSLATHSLSFGWLKQYAPNGLENNFDGIILGLNAIGVFLISIAFIELWMRRSDILGSN